MSLCIAPVLPTRIKVCTHICEASFTTMAIQAGLMPLDRAEIETPLYAPVKLQNSRWQETSLEETQNFTIFATRLGSPGTSKYSAKSPFPHG
jgi:hypothetical protein